jgi:uncharacterized protein YecT (DUF1311 family)
VRARLTNAARGCKVSLVLANLLLTTALAQPSLNGLRDCVANARDPHAIAGCERREQAALEERIERLGQTIRKQLEARERALFERNQTAWQAFFDSERAMLELSLATRRDGLGATLGAGAVNRLYEQRERQLREHLHNLNQRAPRGAADR